MIIGRLHDDAKCEKAADEILDLMKMWGFTLQDAYFITRRMKFVCQNTHVADWKDPLAGTGMHADPLLEPEKFDVNKQN